MALITYILIAIPVCLLAIILWLYFNYWKYKRKNHFILLILLFYPVLSYAQYMDKTQCKISFSSHANQAGKLEYTQDGIIYRFTPESNAWKITIKTIRQECTDKLEKAVLSLMKSSEPVCILYIR